MGFKYLKKFYLGTYDSQGELGDFFLNFFLVPQKQTFKGNPPNPVEVIGFSWPKNLFKLLQ